MLRLHFDLFRNVTDVKHRLCTLSSTGSSWYCLAFDFVFALYLVINSYELAFLALFLLVNVCLAIGWCVLGIVLVHWQFQVLYYLQLFCLFMWSSPVMVPAVCSSPITAYILFVALCPWLDIPVTVFVWICDNGKKLCWWKSRLVLVMLQLLVHWTRNASYFSMCTDIFL